MNAAADWVPVAVSAGVARIARERARLHGSRPGSPVEHAERAERLAVLCEREARWWAVLERWTYSPAAPVPLVFGRAVIMAGSGMRDSAGFWRDSAADWRRRAAGEPVCGVVGCGCDGTCGVAA